MVCGEACFWHVEDRGPKHNAVHRATCADIAETGEISELIEVTVAPTLFAAMLGSL